MKLSRFNFYRDSTKLLTTVVICITMAIGIDYCFLGMNMRNTLWASLSFLGLLILGLIGIRTVYKLWVPKEVTIEETTKGSNVVSGGVHTNGR